MGAGTAGGRQPAGGGTFQSGCRRAGLGPVTRPRTDGRTRRDRRRATRPVTAPSNTRRQRDPPRRLGCRRTYRRHVLVGGPQRPQQHAAVACRAPTGRSYSPGHALLDQRNTRPVLPSTGHPSPIGAYGSDRPNSRSSRRDRQPVTPRPTTDLDDMTSTLVVPASNARPPSRPKRSTPPWLPADAVLV
jgi:hypothetical protein